MASSTIIPITIITAAKVMLLIVCPINEAIIIVAPNVNGIPIATQTALLASRNTKSIIRIRINPNSPFIAIKDKRLRTSMDASSIIANLIPLSLKTFSLYSSATARTSSIASIIPTDTVFVTFTLIASHPLTFKILPCFSNVSITFATSFNRKEFPSKSDRIIIFLISSRLFNSASSLTLVD